MPDSTDADEAVSQAQQVLTAVSKAIETPLSGSESDK